MGAIARISGSFLSVEPLKLKGGFEPTALVGGKSSGLVAASEFRTANFREALEILANLPPMAPRYTNANGLPGHIIAWEPVSVLLGPQFKGGREMQDLRLEWTTTVNGNLHVVRVWVSKSEQSECQVDESSLICFPQDQSDPLAIGQTLKFLARMYLQ